MYSRSKSDIPHLIKYNIYLNLKYKKICHPFCLPLPASHVFFTLIYVLFPSFFFPLPHFFPFLCCLRFLSFFISLPISLYAFSSFFLSDRFCCTCREVPFFKCAVLTPDSGTSHFPVEVAQFTTALCDNRPAFGCPVVPCCKVKEVYK